ncbi:MAG: phosphatase PAP2 family protein [Chloroflexi bacterium]|nr:phosphatase PAP2 family protein [Chloroflexota bacterium]
MEAIWQWGINLIIAIQQVHGPLLDNIFRAITFTGEEQFYLVLFPLIIWCIDYSFGAVLVIFFLLSDFLNIVLKDLIQHPRPFDLNPGLKLSQADGYGMPSGHAQMAVTAWGAIAVRVRKTWFWIVAVMIIFLIGFSRVYLGVHFPTDVLVGWIIGSILLGIYVVARYPLEKWLSGLNMWLQLLLVIGLTVVLLLLNRSSEGLTASGTLFGAAVSLVFARRYVSFSVSGPWWHRVVRFLIGIIVLFGLYLGLKAAFPPDGTALGAIFRFLRYTLLGVWLVLGAPWLFRLMRLAPAAN